MADEMVCAETSLLAAEPVARATLRLVLDAPALVAAARPGQFVMLGPLEPERLDPFLNRPLSIHRAGPAGRLELLVAQVGRGTRAMGGWRPGRPVRLLGPLGRGFDPPAGPASVGLGVGGIPPDHPRAAPQVHHRPGQGGRCHIRQGLQLAFGAGIDNALFNAFCNFSGISGLRKTDHQCFHNVKTPVAG